MTPAAGRSDLASGDMVQWYRIERLLGSGGFGITYLATDTNLDRQVAIKEFFPPALVSRQPDNSLLAADVDSDAEYRHGLRRFLAEARTLVKFAHPSIVRVYSVFEANQTAYLVMEYEDGEDLKTHLRVQGRLEEDYLQQIFLQLADGLEQVHQRGFIHRDIKPSNIIVRRDGTAVLLDFGATRPVGEVGHTTFVSGGYTPLELVQRDLAVGPWTDVYSLAATLYSVITGAAPASATRRLAAMAREIADPLRPAGELSDGRYSEPFLAAIDAALQFHGADRPQTLPQWTALFAPEFNHSPDAAVAQSANRLRAKPPVRASRRQQRRRHWSLLAVAAVLAVSVLAMALQQWREQRRISALLARAEAGYVTGEYVDVALPVYREVLAEQPQHPLARQRIDEIQRLQESLIRRLLDQQRLESASAAIKAYVDSGGQPSGIRKFSEALASARERRQLDDEVDAIEALIQAGQHDVAIERAEALQQRLPSDPRAEKLLAQASAEAERAQTERLRAREVEIEQRRTEAQLQRRIEAANRRQAVRRAAYEERIRNVETALEQGEIAAARRELEIADTYQIDDALLQELRVQLEREERYQSTAFTAAEIEYARRQFNLLERAIEQGNVVAIARLTGAAGSRRQLFTQLLRQYSSVEVEVKSFRVSTAPKRARAILQIVSLTLPNGDTVFPSQSYRSSNLELRRYADRWTPIRW